MDKVSIFSAGYLPTNFLKFILKGIVNLQSVIQEFRIKTVKHELGIFSNRAKGVGGLFCCKVLAYMGSECFKITFQMDC